MPRVEAAKVVIQDLPPFLCSLPCSPEEAALRVEQVRLGAFVRQLRIAREQGLQNSLVILRRALMQRQLTPVGTLARRNRGPE